MLAFCLAYSSTLKLEVTRYSKMSVDFQQNTQRYILDDRTLKNQQHLSNTNHRKIMEPMSNITDI
jgi:hypothetical protein